MICGKCPYFNGGLSLKPKQHMAVCDLADKARRVYRRFDEPCRFAKSTLADMWWQEMKGHTIKQNVCCVCGKQGVLNQHHVPPRSAGNIITGSKSLPKPTLTLCGSGNASGCHAKAHNGSLHFKYRDGRWWYLELDDIPVGESNRLYALEQEGWKECYECDW